MKKAFLIRLIIALFVLGLSVLAVSGIYPVKIMDMQFCACFQRLIVDFSCVALVIILSVIVLTLLFGRFYCSTICPFGILQEVISLLRKHKAVKSKNIVVKYFISALVFGILIGGSAVFIRYIDPYAIFGSLVSLSVFGIIFAFSIFILVLFKNRYFCANICPIGAIIGLISKISFNKIYIDKTKCVSCGLCAKNCPVNAINPKEKIVNNEICLKCLKCISKCPKDAIRYGIAPKETSFDLKRRDFIVMTSALLLFAGAIKAGVEIGKNFAKKVRDVILPAGAQNALRMANKCLNCNLCINNCPNKILVKSDKNYPAVHIDYSNGRGYCEYNCNKCSNVCPSGAIKRISLEEKQKTRIAMAVFREEKCDKCNACSNICPKGAIEKINGKIIINSQKCIGCAGCTKICKNNAIEIYSVNEQEIV